MSNITQLFATNIISVDSLDKKITIHFENYKAELYRYSGLSMYDESRHTIGPEQIDSELRLFEEIKTNDLIHHPTTSVFALCHNILIHSPEKGQIFFQLLNKATTNRETLIYLFNDVIFTGEFGEQLALSNLQSDDKQWSRIWSLYFKQLAMYDFSLPVIEKMFLASTDEEIKVNLLSALSYISNPKSIDFIKHVIETAKSDKILTQAIFVFAELAGNDGIKYLETVKTQGKESATEKKSSIDWLQDETSAKNKYGTQVANDYDFIYRFGDIRSPAMVWIEKQGLMTEKAASKPIALSKTQKDELLELLIQSKGFGLEAIKGSLFLSLEKDDIKKLLQLRQLNYYSPNNFTSGREKTLSIFIRYLKRL